MKLNFGLRALIVSAATLGLVSCAAFRAEDAESVLRRADQAMGGTNLKTIRYAGSGTGGTLGQAYRPGMPWPKINYSSYSRLADYENSALRDEAAQPRGAHGRRCSTAHGYGRTAHDGLITRRRCMEYGRPGPGACAHCGERQDSRPVDHAARCDQSRA